MAGVLFVVTIPTEPEELRSDQRDRQSKLGSNLKIDNVKEETDKNENGIFKIVRSLFIMIILYSWYIVSKV